MIVSFSSLLTFTSQELLENQYALYTIHYSTIFFLNLISYTYIILKFYKVMCYSKLTFEWLPMINPYIWPFSMFQVLTAWYFRLWAKILPPIKFEKTSFEISAIIALEALNSILYFSVKLANFLITILQQTEQSIQIYEGLNLS
jgi:hypothetical protein